MSKLSELIDAAERELGTCEVPLGSNIVKYNDDYWGPSYRQNPQDYPWCVVFLWWIFKLVGVYFPRTAHCNGVEAEARKRGQWVEYGYQPGDCVIFDYDGDGSRDHIGLVIESVNGHIVTIEGNYGDKVARVTHNANDFVGAYRPDFGDAPEEEDEQQQALQDSHPTTAEGGAAPQGAAMQPPQSAEPTAPPDQVEPMPRLSTGDTGPAVAFLQGGLRAIGYPCGDSYYPDGRADGEYGAGTERAVMQLLGVPYVDSEGWKKLIGGLG